jgi:hypothetical protein
MHQVIECIWNCSYPSTNPSVVNVIKLFLFVTNAMVKIVEFLSAFFSACFKCTDQAWARLPFERKRIG